MEMSAKYAISKPANAAIKKAFERAGQYKKIGASNLAKIYAINELEKIAKREYAGIARERFGGWRGKKLNPIERQIAMGRVLGKLSARPTRAQKAIVRKIIDKLMKEGMGKNEK